MISAFNYLSDKPKNSDQINKNEEEKEKQEKDIQKQEDNLEDIVQNHEKETPVDYQNYFQTSETVKNDNNVKNIEQKPKEEIKVEAKKKYDFKF